MSVRQRSPQPSCFWLPYRFNMAPRTPRDGGRTRAELPAPPQAPRARSSSSAAAASSPRQNDARRSTRPPPPPDASSQSRPGDQSAKQQPWRSQEKVNSSSSASKKPTTVQSSLGSQVNPQAPTSTKLSSTTKSHGSSTPPRIQSQVRLQVSTPAPQPTSPTREASLVGEAKLLVDEPKQSARPLSPKEVKPTSNESVHETNTNRSFDSNQKSPAETSAASSSRRPKSYRETEEAESNGLAHFKPTPKPNQEGVPDVGQVNEGEERIQNKQLSSAPETQQTRSPGRSKGNDNEQNGNCSTGKERKIVVSSMPQASFLDGDRATFGKEITEGMSRLAQQINVGRHEQPVSILTLAGKSVGATMTVGHEPVKYRGQDGRPNVINTNVETINNSTLHGSTCNVRDPGVHLDISTKPVMILDTMAEATTPKAERAGSNRIQNQTPNQDPRVRRRCLRALFMESSDSDPGNPRKPRRHGCRYSCEDKKKSKDQDGTTCTTDTMREQNKEGTSKASSKP